LFGPNIQGLQSTSSLIPANPEELSPALSAECFLLAASEEHYCPPQLIMIFCHFIALLQEQSLIQLVVSYPLSAYQQRACAHPWPFDVTVSTAPNFSPFCSQVDCTVAGL